MPRQFRNLVYQIVSVLILISAGSSQITKECETGTSCKPLVECPEILNFARSPDFNIKRKYINSICGFLQIFLVCCPNKAPSGGGSLPPVIAVSFPGGGGGGTNPPATPSGGDFLPDDCGQPFTADRIHGGRPAPIGAYPWIVALGYTELGIRGVKFDCSGSLISNRYVLTAAHCLHQDSIGARKLSVIHLGDWDLTTTPDCQAKGSGRRCYPPHIEAKPGQITLHPSYNKRAQHSDDIALIRLDRTISFNSLATAPIKPVCLPSERQSARRFAQGRRVLAAGWGFTEHGNRSDILLRVLIPFADDKLCRDIYGRRFVSNQLCLGGAQGKDTCQGDSGGPLVISGPRGPPFFLIGIVSYGSLCGEKDKPAVYTAVSEYVGWIKQNLSP